MEKAVNSMQRDSHRPEKSVPYVIVVGSEKGGTGKSTTAIHLTVGLMKLGFRVGTIDLDARQGTFTAFWRNRAAQSERALDEQVQSEHRGRPLEQPKHRAIQRSTATEPAATEADEAGRLQDAFDDLADCHFIVIDTPGSDSYLCRLGHHRADTLVTPLNDSFLDIEVLAHINRERREVEAPSVYSQLVWEQNNQRVVAGRPPIDWVVLRNRLAHLEARNMREIQALLALLAKRIGFRLAPGISERVVFRELFMKGLTALDLPEARDGQSEVGSHVAARREIQGLLQTIGVLEAETA